MSDFEATVGLIMERTGMGRDELMALITKKRVDLKYFVTLEGATGMVAKELGVKNDG